MSALQFAGEWALRSSILILTGAVFLWALRLRDPSIRLMAWTAMLCGSLSIPAIGFVFPKIPFAVVRSTSARAEAPVAMIPLREPAGAAAADAAPAARPINWSLAVLTLYCAGLAALVFRLGVGLAMSLRLLRESSIANRLADGIEVRESDRIATPVTLGILRPAIVLPADWREWDPTKLDSVLAHERSHIRRHDPAVQLLSAIHRAVLWHSPLSWFLHRRIVRAAEEASDDAAVASTGNRAFYAEVLLEFMQRTGNFGAGNWRNAEGTGVPMARYGRPDRRIHRILDGTSLSAGVTRRGVAAILIAASPLTWLAGAAHPQNAAPLNAAPLNAAPQAQTKAVAQAAVVETPEAKPSTQPGYLMALGNVTASSTVVVKSRVDGQLMSVNFREGEQVQAGQVLASIDPRPFEIQLDQAQGRLTQDEAQAAAGIISPADAKLRTDRAEVDGARLQLSYARITSPIAGVTGLRLVDPGNFVRAADSAGIVVVTQLHPAAVLFNVPEDELPRVRALLASGANVRVEAWNRDNRVRLGKGQLTAMDNQIDYAAGTVKLKAVFDNKDDALFPNQFVNVRMFSAGR